MNLIRKTKCFLFLLGTIFLLTGMMSLEAHAENNAGAFNVTGGKRGVDWVCESDERVLRFIQSGTYTVTGNGNQAWGNRIVIGSDNNQAIDVTITLKNVNIKYGFDEGPFLIKAGANVTLNLEENNILECDSASGSGLCNYGTLTIQGNGSLRAESIATSQNATFGGAGIYGSNITIKGGNITAKSNVGYSAGIGGSFNNPSVENILIEGGNVTAYGNGEGAGIGSGSSAGTGSSSDSQITAKNIKITGGTVKAYGGVNPANGWGGAGIGAGAKGSADNTIIIEGGNIYAKGGRKSAGIGGGFMAGGGIITIKGGTVTAEGGLNYADPDNQEDKDYRDHEGIGNGQGNMNAVCIIQITGGSVKSSFTKEPTGLFGLKKVYLAKLDNQNGINQIKVDNGTYTRSGDHPNDGAFYLYLIGRDHELVSNGTKYRAVWNSGNTSFTIKSYPPKPTITSVSVTSKKATVTLKDSASYGGVEYKIDNGNWTSWPSSNELTGLSPNTTYTISVRYKGNDTYVESDAATQQIKTKQVPVIIEPTNLTAIYGQKLSDVTLSDGWVWVNGNTQLKVGSKSFEAKLDVSSLESTYDYTEITGYDPVNHCVKRSLMVSTFKAPVTNQGVDTEMEYSGVTIDVSQCFKLDPNAGAATYSLDSNAVATTGQGTLDGKTLTVEDTGVFIIKVNTAETENYLSGGATAILTVNDGTIGYSAKGYKGIYDGNSHSISVEITSPDDAKNAEVTYSTDGENYSGDNPSFINADDYVVYYKIEKKNYKTVRGLKTVNISQAPVDIKIAETRFQYDGSTIDISKCFRIGDHAGNATYSLGTYDGENAGAGYLSNGTMLSVTKTGIFEIILNTASNGNYAAGKATAIVTVSDGKIEYSAEGYNGTYDGGKHGIFVNVTSPEGTTVSYSSDGNSYDSNNPQFINAGTYTLHYKIEKDNYATETGSRTVTIAPKKITVTADDKTKVYGEEEAELTYSIKEELITGDELETISLTRVEGEAAGEYTITVSQTEGSNPNYEIEFVNGTYTIQKAPVTIDGKDVQLSYGGELVDITGLFELDPNGGEPTYSLRLGTGEGFLRGGTLKVTGLGTFEVTVKTEEMANYSAGEKTITLTVGRRDIADADVKLGDPLIYNREEQIQKIRSVTIGTLPVTYMVTGNKATKVGTYEMTLTGTGNFTGQKKVTFTIATMDKAVKEAQATDICIRLNNGLKITQNSGEIRMKWASVPDADGYDVYVQYCGKNMTAKTCTTLKGGKNTSLVVKKIKGKKINQKKNFKLCIVAWKMVEGEKEVLGSSLLFHIIGRKNTIESDVKAIRLKKKSYSLKAGKTARIKAELILEKPSRKLLQNHEIKPLRYISSDNTVAKVTESGKIKAVGKGTCTIHVYAYNVCMKKIKVNVK